MTSERTTDMTSDRQTDGITDGTPDQLPEIWTRQEAIASQLKTWGLGSIIAGSAIALGSQVGPSAIRGRGFRAFGIQTAAWGAVDLAIAVFGEMRRRGRLETVDPAEPAVVVQEARNLRRILLVNAGLDVGYVTFGALGLARGLRQSELRDSALAGHSAAVLVQGLFLLGFDAGHARAISIDG